MKRIKGTFYLMVFIICIVLAYFIINYSAKEEDNTYMNKGLFVKSIALMLYSQEECNLELEDSEDWYTTYLTKLDSSGYLKKADYPSSKNALKTKLEYQDIIDFINQLKIDQEEILTLIEVHDHDEQVKSSEYALIYDLLLQQIDIEHKIQKLQIGIVQVEEDKNFTTKGEFLADGLTLSDDVDHLLEVYVKDNEILFISKDLGDELTYSNAYAQKVENGVLYAFIDGVNREFKINGIDETIKGSVVDLQLKNSKLYKIVVKKDTISGKVLEIDETGVEIEKYAKLSFTEDFKVYQTYGNLQMQSVNKILVGYDTTTFFVANGKICAALINTDIDAENIRVLIKDNNFANLFHSSVTITCDSSFKVTYGDVQETYEAGHQIQLDANSSYLTSGRVKFEPVDTNQKLIISSIKRGYGIPSYRGSIEVAKNGSGLLIINELPLEEYLYSVIPSEMPVSYGLEALYAQAVCARSYAYRQLLDNAYSKYGAHVDDSVSYQVYNNVLETEESIQAAKETYGKILTYKGEVIQAFFFSTSAGATTDATVWGNSNLPYIQGRILTKEGTQLDLTKNDVFSSFIRQKVETYDSEFPWYRWECTISLSNLSDSINKNIKKRYDINHDNILTLNSSGVFVCSDISSIGELKKIEVSKRSSGGVISELILYGSQKTVLVKTESNIRNLINVDGIDIHRNDGSVVNTSKNLPSAYFVLDDVIENNVLTGYKFTGGGFGHGVGMSQNAAKAMTESGMDWEEILKYFYCDVEISDI